MNQQVGGLTEPSSISTSPVLDDWFGGPSASHKLMAQELTELQESKPTRNKVKARSEQAIKGWLERTFNASLRKADDREVTNPDGRTFRVSKDVDLIGSLDMVYQGEIHTYPVKIEVKGISDDHFPLGNLSNKEINYLNKSVAKNNATLLALVWWKKVESHWEIEKFHLIPWKKWPEILKQIQAIKDGSFRGRSIRRKDLKLFTEYEVIKHNNRYMIPAHCWLSSMAPKLGLTTEQATIPF